MSKSINFLVVLFDWMIVRKSLYKSMVKQSSTKDTIIKEFERTIHSLRENNLRLHNEIVAKDNVIQEHVQKAVDLIEQKVNAISKMDIMSNKLKALESKYVRKRNAKGQFIKDEQLY